MSRAAVESTLFRARKRLGEEYEELVSGKRCLRVQRIVEERRLRAAGLRDQRRVARHLAHCQPCRRHAYLAGADLDLRPPGVRRAARVAAFLPLPAFLRRRWGGGEEAAQLLSQQAARPSRSGRRRSPARWTRARCRAGRRPPRPPRPWRSPGVGGAAIEHRGGRAARSPATGALRRRGRRRRPAAHGGALGHVAPHGIGPAAAGQRRGRRACRRTGAGRLAPATGAPGASPPRRGRRRQPTARGPARSARAGSRRAGLLADPLDAGRSGHRPPGARARRRRRPGTRWTARPARALDRRRRRRRHSAGRPRLARHRPRRLP